MATIVNSKADVLKSAQALAVNCNAARGLQEIMKSNLGPRGTLKMLVGGAGQIKITKDGNVLLHEMQIQHPTASMIARAATAQDDATGDGTTSNVLFIGELMKLSERHLSDGVHPRLIVEGFDHARLEALSFLEKLKLSLDAGPEVLYHVARTALRTKIPVERADQLAKIVIGAIQCLEKSNTPIDLHMVEIMHMKEKLVTDTRLVQGLVLDHGSRHPDMPKKLENCYVLTLNVSLEYEKTEVHSSFFYSSAEQRDKLVESERKFTDEKVMKIIELKQKVCKEGSGNSFVVINQKGIDPPSLDMLAKEGIIALRRAKRRNMERLVLACGGNAVNSVDDLDVEDLGYADSVYEKTLGDDKYTFVEGVKNPQSCTILIKGPNEHTIAQMKDAVRDGLRAVKNAMEDKSVLPGAGAVEVYLANHMKEFGMKNVSGKARLGVEVFADALMVIPKTLADNSGFDVADTSIRLMESAYRSVKEDGSLPNADAIVGLDIHSGDACSPFVEGIFDNYSVKRQMLMLAPVLAQQLLLVDEVIRAGKQMRGS